MNEKEIKIEKELAVTLIDIRDQLSQIRVKVSKYESPEDNTQTTRGNQLGNLMHVEQLLLSVNEYVDEIETTDGRVSHFTAAVPRKN